MQLAECLAVWPSMPLCSCQFRLCASDSTQIYLPVFGDEEARAEQIYLGMEYSCLDVKGRKEAMVQEPNSELTTAIVAFLLNLSDAHPREHDSKHSTYHQWYALPTKRALVAHLPYILPTYMSLDLLRNVIRSMAHFRLCLHTLQVKTVTWNHNTSSTCDLCIADDIQGAQHVLFPCIHPHVVSLRCNYTISASPPQIPMMHLLSGQEQQRAPSSPL